MLMLKVSDRSLTTPMQAIAEKLSIGIQRVHMVDDGYRYPAFSWVGSVQKIVGQMRMLNLTQKY